MTSSAYVRLLQRVTLAYPVESLLVNRLAITGDAGIHCETDVLKQAILHRVFAAPGQAFQHVGLLAPLSSPRPSAAVRVVRARA